MVYAFDDNAQRARWSNLPVSFVQRGGIMRGDLNERQSAALDRLLEQVLSEEGVRNARLQMAAACAGEAVAQAMMNAQTAAAAGREKKVMLAPEGFEKNQRGSCPRRVSRAFHMVSFVG